MTIAKSILGRLGNQMFQHAYCKAIKEALEAIEKVYPIPHSHGGPSIYRETRTKSSFLLTIGLMMTIRIQII